MAEENKNEFHCDDNPKMKEISAIGFPFLEAINYGLDLKTKKKKTTYNFFS